MSAAEVVISLARTPVAQEDSTVAPRAGSTTSISMGQLEAAVVRRMCGRESTIWLIASLSRAAVVEQSVAETPLGVTVVV